MKMRIKRKIYGREIEQWGAHQEELFEPDCCNGSNEILKIFIQKCVKYLENASLYTFRVCGHQCICEHCYQSKGDVDLLKLVTCKT